MLMPSIFGENLFDDFFDDFARPAKRNTAYTQAPAVMRTDVKEKEDSYELEIDLPGYKKENVKAQLKDGYMTITAEAKKDTDEKAEDGRYIRREKYYGTCSRSFYVGKNVTEEDIKAKFEDGVLKVTVPKKQAKPKEDKFISIEG